MRSLKVLAAAAVLATSAATVNAGGLAPVPAPAPVAAKDNSSEEE